MATDVLVTTESGFSILEAVSAAAKWWLRENMEGVSGLCALPDAEAREAVRRMVRDGLAVRA